MEGEAEPNTHTTASFSGSTERGEQSRARNTGVKASTAPIVVSLDDDDLLTPTALERHVEALREHPQAIASVGGHENFDDQGAKKRYQLVRRKQVRSIYRDILFGWMATAGESAFRREILERVNYWDESWLRATDHELWSRVGSLGDVVILPDIVLNYRVHSGQWRPPDLEAIVTRAREKAVALTEGEQRRSGEETLAVRSVFQRAYEHFLAARAWSALGLYLEATWRMPSLLTSPLTRPMILHPMSRCLFGPWGIRLGRVLLPKVERRPRHSGPIAAQSPGGGTFLSQAVERAGPGASPADHGQAAQLLGRAPHRDADRDS